MTSLKMYIWPAIVRNKMEKLKNCAKKQQRKQKREKESSSLPKFIYMNNQLVAFEVVSCVAVSTPKKESES